MSSGLGKDNNKSLFITFEGVEGAGKTTNIDYIAEKIKASGQEFILTREPGGTILGEKVRDLLISKELPEMHHNTELLLMFAARAEHVQQVIQPALKKGLWVLCDRFTDASYAYQGAGRGISSNNIEVLEKLVQGSLRPDVTFLFDLNAEVGLSRAQSRGETDRFEQQHIDFFNRVRDEYLNIAKKDSSRFRIVDAEYELATVQKQIDEYLEKLIS